MRLGQAGASRKGNNMVRTLERSFEKTFKTRIEHSTVRMDFRKDAQKDVRQELEVFRLSGFTFERNLEWLSGFVAPQVPGEAVGPGFPFSCPRGLGMGPAGPRGSSLLAPYDAKGFLYDGISICRHMTADRKKISPFRSAVI